MRKIGTAVMAMAFLPLLGGLSGCSKTPKYTADDIKSFSVSCGHMDYSHSYSFYLRNDESGWLLDAEYAVDTEQLRTEYEERPVAEEDVKELLTAVCEQNIIEKLRRFKKPKIKLQVADETNYYTSILFTDGESLGASTHISDDLVTDFYHLAEKYARTVSE